MKVAVGVKNAQATEKTCGSDMVAEGMMEVISSGFWLLSGAYKH